jgi:hypothetical protein
VINVQALLANSRGHYNRLALLSAIDVASLGEHINSAPRDTLTQRTPTLIPCSALRLRDPKNHNGFSADTLRYRKPYHLAELRQAALLALAKNPAAGCREQNRST